MENGVGRGGEEKRIREGEPYSCDTKKGFRKTTDRGQKVWEREAEIIHVRKFMTWKPIRCRKEPMAG